MQTRRERHTALKYFFIDNLHKNGAFITQTGQFVGDKYSILTENDC